MSLQKRIKEAEGFRPKPYFDTLGISTIGYGFTHLTRQESDWILATRLDAIESSLWPMICDLSELRRETLIEMAYQIGEAGLMRFSKMWGFIRMGDYEAAAKEIIDSKLARQTPHRAGRYARQMVAG